MKRYLRSDESFESRKQQRYDTIVAVAEEAAAKYDCVMNFKLSYGNIVGTMIEYKGSTENVDQGQPCVDGYCINFNPLWLQFYEYGDSERTIEDVNISSEISRYIEDFDRHLARLHYIVDQIPLDEAVLDEACTLVTNRLSEEYAQVTVTYALSPWVTNVHGEVTHFGGILSNEPKFGIKVVADSALVSFYCGHDNITTASGTAGYMIKQLRKQLRKQFNRDQSVASILAQHGVDMTKAQYELRAQTYERYSSGKYYTKKFTCPGDYLAYFSMRVHGSPTTSRLTDYFGDMGEFAEFVDEYPTIQDIADYASSTWWGDGDDYIIYLKNLTTGKYLYESEEGEEEFEEEDWED